MHVKDLFNLEGKTAIITGGGRGLGQQIAESLAEAGANIVVCSRKVEACEETAESLLKKDVQALALPCDVSKQEDVQRVIDETIARMGSVDILVNNSGASWGAPTLDMPLDKWEKVMAVNATGTFLFSQAAAKHMVKQKYGKIINIASTAGLHGSPAGTLDAIGYSSSKGAVLAFTRDLAVKLAPDNIQVNAIAPGFFPTKMSKGVLEKIGDSYLEKTPAKRFGSDRDMKGAALFLASASSDYIIGHTLVVDGGVTVS
ncbi:SDR family oxidoreductase [Alteribacillus sp. JSM 102045]|uniref:SDR family oxidoreductase n=1 Tax=Alteribacillus sp. JSM 102045 TaxID=1562101 RepID=UPI0035BEDA0E